MNKELAIMAGPSNSGKSTYCNELQWSGWTIICPDDFRLVMHGQEFVPSMEPLVWATVEIAVKALLRRDHKVIIDATNTTRAARKVWRGVAKEFGLTLKCAYMNTPQEVCIERAIRKGASHMVPVIEKHFDQWEPIDEEDIVVFHA